MQRVLLITLLGLLSGVGKMQGQCDPIEYDTFYDAQLTTVPPDLQDGGVECYTITPASTYQTGAIWSNATIDLSSSFAYSYYVNLGSNNTYGADGIVFVLSNDPAGQNALGEAGGALAYGGVSGISPSIAVEFDTFDNGGGQTDIVNDHAMLHYNGVMDGPASSAVDLGDIEDGAYHLVEVVWDAVGMVFTVYFDGMLIITENNDLVNNVFGGEPNVLIGFTGSTGLYFNNQIVCDIQVIYTEICNGIDDDCDGEIDEDLATFTAQDAEICDGDEFVVGFSSYTESGVYTDVLISSVGCDSVVETTLVVHEVITYVEQVSICEGATYVQGASEYSTSGVYYDTYENQFECDSIIQTELTVLDIPAETLSIDLCPGQAYLTDQNSYATAGQFNETYTAANGCDSLVTIEISILPTYAIEQSHVICEGNSFSVGNSSYMTSGVYVDMLQAQDGCDSVVTTTLLVIDELNVPDSTLCEGQVFQLDMTLYPFHAVEGFSSVNGNIYTFDQAGTGTMSVDLDGCVLETSFELSQLPALYDVRTELDLCEGEPLVIWGRDLGLESQWNTGQEEQAITIDEPGLYIMEHEYYCGDVQDRFLVESKACDCAVFVPNAFTPDNDEVNDRFGVIYECDFRDFEFTVFGRDGRVIFHTENPTVKWNGGVGAYYVSPGVYTWLLRYSPKDPTLGQDVEKRGSVSVIR